MNTPPRFLARGKETCLSNLLRTLDFLLIGRMKIGESRWVGEDRKTQV